MNLIGPFSQILSFSNLNLNGAIADNELSIVSEGGVLIVDGRIKKLGNFQNLHREFSTADVTEIAGDRVLLPAFVDCHTHLCFGGTRSADFARRNGGMSYLEIMEKGGGIWNSVEATRNASNEELSLNMDVRMKLLLHAGISAVEIKTGYGLSADHELRFLRLINELSSSTNQTVIPTCLAAHIIPREFDRNEKAYLDYIISEIVPAVLEEKLATRFDAFVEQSAFSVDGTRDYFNSLKRMGFDLTVHGDQFTTGGSVLAVEMGAQSVDHLEVSTEVEINVLAKSNTVAVALPGASLGIGCAFTPARKLLDAGAILAIASDWNPGSAPMGDLLTQASILACFEKLSTAEVLAAMTFRAAKALGIEGHRLDEGECADMISFPTDDYREILYHQGQMRVNEVWINGVSEFSV